MRVAIGIVSGRNWHPKFVMSLIGLLLRPHDGLEYIGVIPEWECGMLPKARRIVVEKAIKNGFTHLLSVDDDMIFPADALERIARHNKPFVLANYSSRKFPGQPTVIGLPPSEKVDGKLVYSKGKTGLKHIGETVLSTP